MKKLVFGSILLLTIACKKEISNEIPANKRAYNSAEELGKGAIMALQQHSAEQYLHLGFSSDDFQTFMGQEAKAFNLDPQSYSKEAASNYENFFLPEMKKSFEKINQQGLALNIRWSDVKFINVEATANMDKESSIAITPLAINFSYLGKNAQLLIKKAIVINGKWMISQFAELK